MFGVNMISTSGLSKKKIRSKVSFRIAVLACAHTEMVLLCVCFCVCVRETETEIDSLPDSLS